MLSSRLGELAGYFETLTYKERDEFLSLGMAEMESRSRDALTLYRPLPTQMPFHLSAAPQRLMLGGKRSGKTTAVAAEFSSAVTGIPILGPDDKPLPFQYPRKGGLAFIIGWDEAHIGDPIYRILFKPGYLRAIKDIRTGQWRMWNPADREDAARENESQPAGPMIPPRLVNQRTWAWEKSRENIFNSVELVNGWKIYAFPSTSRQAKQGVPVNLIWIDEDIANEKHLPEWEDRLSSTAGKMVWSAWPHSENAALVSLNERAEKGDRFVHKTVLRYSDNPFITETAKEQAVARMATAEERRARDYGEFTFDKILMYLYNESLHGLPYEEGTEDVLSQVYRDNRGLPKSWTRYLYVDPGYEVQAALIIAVPPPDRYGKRLIVEDEAYVKRGNVNDFAKCILEKATGKYFAAFVADWRAMRQTPMGGGPTYGQIYSDAFEECGLVSSLTSHGFLPGSDNVGARSARVRELMRPGEDGPAFRIIHEKCHNTVFEFSRYKRRVTKDETTDVPVAAFNHAMNCIEYAAMHDPEYVVPDDSGRVMPWRVRQLRELLSRHNKDDDSVVLMGPPSLT